VRACARSFSLIKYLFNTRLQAINDSKLFRTFFLLCLTLRDAISSITFRCLNLRLFSFLNIRVFSQFISSVHSILCLTKPRLLSPFVLLPPPSVHFSYPRVLILLCLVFLLSHLKQPRRFPYIHRFFALA
jgi:hypothetical protein